MSSFMIMTTSTLIFSTYSHISIFHYMTYLDIILKAIGYSICIFVLIHLINKSPSFFYNDRQLAI